MQKPLWLLVLLVFLSAFCAKGANAQAWEILASGFDTNLRSVSAAPAAVGPGQ